ncbi:hypothetical protein [Streptomyces griseus]|uniref:hypothetical protein n=1 Tax=Streptomyces griseus TaxID=1911 RepID=UPI00378DD060
MTTETTNTTFAAACALVRAGAEQDEAGLRALLDTRDPDELASLTLATAALAQLFGLLAHGGDQDALVAHLEHMIRNQQP